MDVDPKASMLQDKIAESLLDKVDTAGQDSGYKVKKDYKKSKNKKRK